MTGQEVITKFELYVDDSTELSSAEELALLQKVYNKVWYDRPWEFAKTTASGTIALTSPHITLPADFSHFVENNQDTNNASSIDNNASPKVIFVGSALTPYQIVNWSDRRAYSNRSGYAYLDLANNGIVFSTTPASADSYEFDYQKIPPTLTLVGSITGIPARFQDILYHAMAVDDDIVQRYPKAHSYAPENQARYLAYLDDMAFWNAQLILN